MTLPMSMSRKPFPAARKFSAGIAALWALAGCSPAPAPDAEPESASRAQALSGALTLPLTGQKLYDYLVSNGITTKAGLLAALPAAMRGQLVLMSDSRSRHKGTRALPRVISYSRDARFFVAASGHDKTADPAADSIEIIEFDETAKEWRFLTIDFDGGRKPPNRDQSRCTGCHGTPPRPIWDEYPNWPHSYGGLQGSSGVDRMTAAEYSDFSTFLSTTAKTNDTYKSLLITKTSYGFYLQDTDYGFPNTVLTSRIGERQADSVYTRMSKAARFGKYQYALQVLNDNMDCPTSRDLEAAIAADYAARLRSDSVFSAKWTSRPTPSVRTQLYRLLDIDTLHDLRIDDSPRTPFQPSSPGRLDIETFEWNSGSDFLSAYVEFIGLKALLDSDATLRGYFAGRAAQISNTHRYAFRASAAELDALDAVAQRERVASQVVSLEYKKAMLQSAGAPASEIEAVERELQQARQQKELKGDYYRDALFPSLHFNVYYPILKDIYRKYGEERGENKGAAVCSYLTGKAVTAARGP